MELSNKNNFITFIELLMITDQNNTSFLVLMITLFNNTIK